MASNTTEFNVKVNVDSQKVVAGANMGSVALMGMGGKGALAGKMITASMVKATGAIVVLTASFVALKKVIEHATEVGSEFEQSIADVRATLGASQTEFRLLSAEAQRLGRETKFTANEVAGLEKEYGKLGFNTQEILGATEATLSLAAAVGAGLSRSAEVAGGTLRGFGLEATETGRVADVMAKSFTTSALDMEKFANSMVYVAPVASAFGFTIEDTTALLGELANVQISGSMAGTSLRQILSQIVVEGSKMSKVFGTNVRNFDEFVELLVKTKKQGGLTNKQIGMIPVRLRSSTIALVNASDNLINYRTELQNAGGSAQRMAEIQMDTLTGSLLELNSAWDGFGIVFFERFLGKLQPGIDLITDLVSGLTDLLEVPLSEKLKQDQVEMNALFGALERSNIPLEIRQKHLERINIEYGDYLPFLLNEESSTKDLAKARKEANDEFRKGIILTAAQEKMAELVEDNIDDMLDYGQAILDTEKAENTLKTSQDARNAELERMNELLGLNLSLEEMTEYLLNVRNRQLKAAESNVRAYGEANDETFGVDRRPDLQNQVEVQKELNNMLDESNFALLDLNDTVEENENALDGAIKKEEKYAEKNDQTTTALNTQEEQVDALIKKYGQLNKTKSDDGGDGGQDVSPSGPTQVTVEGEMILPNIGIYQNWQDRLNALQDGGLSHRMHMMDQHRLQLQQSLVAEYNLLDEAGKAEFDLKMKNAEIINSIEEMKNRFRIQMLEQELGQMTSNAKMAAKEGIISGKLAKAVAISEATVSMYLGATKAYTAMAGIPIIGPALATAAQGMAIVGGLANIKAISKQKFAKGGAVTSPTLAMIGEAGEEEFVAPKQQFTEWANNTLGIENNFNDGNIVSKLTNIETAISKQPTANDIANAISRTNRGRLN